MKCEMQTYEYLPCALKVFRINGIDADITDFGEGKDVDPESAPDYGCGCHRFIGSKDKDVMEKAMTKYGITEEDYMEIISELEEVLHVGYCALCD